VIKSLVYNDAYLMKGTARARQTGFCYRLLLLLAGYHLCTKEVREMIMRNEIQRQCKIIS
jgi:hypothetical protein